MLRGGDEMLRIGGIGDSLDNANSAVCCTSDTSGFVVELRKYCLAVVACECRCAGDSMDGGVTVSARIEVCDACGVSGTIT